MAIIKSSKGIKLPPWTLKDSLKLLDNPRAWKVDTHMVLNPFVANLKRRVKLNVLRELGVTGRILRNMRITELRILLCMLQDSTSAIQTELERRIG